MCRHKEFNHFAEQCEALMEDRDVAMHVQELQAMAKAWRELAAEEERIFDLVQAVDDLFDRRDRSAGPGQQGNVEWGLFGRFRPVKSRDHAAPIELKPAATASPAAVPLVPDAGEFFHPEQQPAGLPKSPKFAWAARFLR